LAAKEYTYTYEERRIIRATESSVQFDGEIVIAKNLLNSVRYVYDNEGTLTKKIVTPANGTAQTNHYETTDDNTVVKFKVGGKTVFGR